MFYRHRPSYFVCLSVLPLCRLIPYALYPYPYLCYPYAANFRTMFSCYSSPVCLEVLSGAVMTAAPLSLSGSVESGHTDRGVRAIRPASRRSAGGPASSHRDSPTSIGQTITARQGATP